MNPPPPYGGWNVPGPPPPPRRRLQGGRVGAGIGTALLGHVLSVVAIILAAAADTSSSVNIGMYVLLGGQALLFVGCLTVGIVLITRDDPSFGTGLLIGWAIGIVAAPVIGIGVCFVAFSQAGL